MPQFVVLRRTDLPEGVLGRVTYFAGTVICVSDAEATVLREHPEDYKDLTGMEPAEWAALVTEARGRRWDPTPTHNTMAAPALVTKAAEEGETDG